MSTRTRQRKTSKKSATKTATSLKTQAPKLPTLDVRNRRPFMTAIQIEAAFAASLAGVTYTRITGWHELGDGTARYSMPSGAGLTYTPDADTPLTAWTPCPQGVRHPHPVTTRADLLDAQMVAARCTDPHGDTPVRLLADRITLAAEDTQTTDVRDLRADAPQEHPHD